MEFRQDHLMHRELSILSMTLLLLWGILNLSGSFLADMPLFSLFLLILLLVPLIWYSLSGSRISVNESGICCRGRKAILWSYTWQEIRVLRCVRLNRYPVIHVVPIEPPRQDLQSPQAPPRLYFQASRKMRKQIRSICQCAFEE